MALFWKTKIIQARIEVTEGVGVIPSAADAILTKDVSFTPMDGQDVSRALERPYFGNQGTIPASVNAKLSFKVELAGSGAAGTVPAWGKLMRGCAMAETVTPGTSVIYSPITNQPDSLTINFFIEDTRYRMVGARGTAKIMIDANAIPHIEFEFTGVFKGVSETAPDVPDYSAWQKPAMASTINTPIATVSGQDFVVEKFSLDMGIQVEPRHLIGSEAVLITGRSETIEMTVEAVPVNIYNPTSRAEIAAEEVIALQHGTQAGNIVRLDVPIAQAMRPGGPTPSQDVTHWPLRFAPQPSVGNDQFILTVT